MVSLMATKGLPQLVFFSFYSQITYCIIREGISIISNDALASLTLFIASSKPEEMDTVKKLVISVLNRNKI